jgi:hypothetical protein
MQDNREEVVVRWVDEVSSAPAELKPLVDAYRRRQEIVDGCAAYPRHVDLEMDVLYDALLVLAKDMA